MACMMGSGCTPDPPPPAAPRDAGTDPDIREVPRPAPPPPPTRELGDLDRVLERGALRVLTHGEDTSLLPRAGGAAAHQALIEQFAERQNVRVEWVSVARFEDLDARLLDGTGDIIAAPLAVTPERKKQLALSRPTDTVSALVVHKRGAPALPAITALQGRSITVAAGLRDVADALTEGVPALTVNDAEQDAPSLLEQVGSGAVPLALVDSATFAQVNAYQPDIEAALVVKEGRQLAWGMRKENPKLKAAADAFLVEAALHAHALEKSTGDLDAIKKRGSLRVLTRNNAVSYFLHKGTQQGFDYELIALFARQHGLRVDIIVPPDASDLIPWLLEGRGDVIAAQMTVTDERKQRVHFSEPYLFADEVLVQRSGDAPLTELAQLHGKRMAVRKSASYAATLGQLQAAHGPFTVEDVPEDEETEHVIAQVGNGAVPMTVADSTIAAVQMAWGVPVQTTLVLAAQQPIAWATRPHNKAIGAALDAFIKKNYRGLDYNVLKKKYFEQTREPAAIASSATPGSVSPWDALLRQRSAEYGFDWRLMAAQAYQESRFDPKARSWVGAMGLFQVMPATGKELGFTDLEDPDQGITAGVKYMAQLVDRFDPKIPFKHRVRFALASYNAGRGHVEDARLLAQQMGLDPDRWFKNVEVAMLRLQDPRVARRTRHGYCRGEEPVKYVSEIQSRYDNYLTVVPDAEVAAR